uniref:Uncharacterized protein n=1 Tax=Lotharella globosa TaxID=91324 RepID=A0A7S3Z872_9EUKA|mmetsp:Transcript_4442/g.8658  ORF Transcript_4442/g.8658 Transcript_4442/m.8658 type:complete len:266 (+) Transcript_4442:61-858(+)
MFPRSSLLVGLLAVIPHVAGLQDWLSHEREVRMATAVEHGLVLTTREAELDGVPVLTDEVLKPNSSVQVSVAAGGDVVAVESAFLEAAANRSSPEIGVESSRTAAEGESLPSPSSEASSGSHAPGLNSNNGQSSAKTSSEDDDDEGDEDEEMSSLSSEDLEVIILDDEDSTDAMKVDIRKQVDQKSKDKLGTSDWGPIVGLGLFVAMLFLLIALLIPRSCGCCKTEKPKIRDTKSATSNTRLPRRVPASTPTTPNAPVETDIKKP